MIVIVICVHEEKCTGQTSVCGGRRDKHSGDVSFVQKKAVDGVRKTKAGGSVEATASQTLTHTDPTQLSQRTGTCTESRGEGC